MLHRRLHAQPFRVALHREARAEDALRHIADDAGARGVDGVRTDIDMAHRADLAAERDVVADIRRAGNARLRDDEAVRPDLAVVTDVHEIVDLRAVADDRRAHRRAVDAVMRADLDIVLEHDVADLRHLRMHAVLRRETETVRADDGRAVDDAALADAAMLAHGRVGVDDRILPDLAVLTDIDAGIERDAVADHGVIIHAGERQDRDILAELYILADMRLAAHAFREDELRRKEREQGGKGCPRLRDIERGAREILNTLRQHDSRRARGLRLLDMRLDGESEVMLARTLDIIQSGNHDILIADDTAADIVRNLLQRLFHALTLSA